MGLSVVRLGLQASALERDNLPNSAFEENGENLFHRGEAVVSYRMPMASVTQALLINHSSALSRKTALAACAFIQLSLILALAVFLGAPAAGVVAVTVFSAMRYGEFNSHASVLFFYSILITLVAATIARWAEKPSVMRSLAAGAMVGVSLTFRSVLAFFPLLLGLLEPILVGAGRPRWTRRHFLALCLFPYVFLVPWAAMNWAIFREFIPFEYREANEIIVQGALGQIFDIPGEDSNRFLPDKSKTGHVILWAANEVFRHPVRFARGYWKRLLFAVSQAPFLYFFALLGLIAHWKKKAFRAIGLLIAYFLGVHCLMGVVPGYFVPLYPLLVVLACSPIDSLLRRAFGVAWNSGTAQTLSARFVHVFALAALLYGLFILGLVSRYSLERDFFSATRWKTALDREILSYPEDVWLRSRRGSRRLERGNIAGALADLSEAAKLQPTSLRLSALLQARIWADDPQSRSEFMQARAALDAGNEDLALRHLRQVPITGPGEALWHRFALEAAEVKKYQSAVAALKRLTRASPGSGLYLKDLGVMEFHSGDELGAIKDLQLSVDKDPKLLSAYLSLGYLYSRRGRASEALKIYERALLVLSPKDPEVLPVILEAREALVLIKRF